MHEKRHGLGKGMGSLLTGFDYDAQIENVVTKTIGEKEEKPKEPVVVEKPAEKIIPRVEEIKKTESVVEVKLSDIKPNPNQPRKSFDEEALESLADSIKSKGIIQPLILMEYAPGKYSIIAGERRFRAAALAGLQSVPAIVRSMDEVSRMEVALIENIQRSDLNPIEEAFAYQELMVKSRCTQEELAAKLGKSRSLVANTLRLLSLSDNLKDDVISGLLSPGHARAILSLKNPADQELLRNKIVEKNLTVREAEELASEYNKGHKVVSKRGKEKEDDVFLVESKFSSAIGAHIELKGSLEKGRIEIKFRSQKELERIYSALSDGEELFEE